jgi:hypothetical protein
MEHEKYGPETLLGNWRVLPADYAHLPTGSKEEIGSVLGAPYKKMVCYWVFSKDGVFVCRTFCGDIPGRWKFRSSDENSMLVDISQSPAPKARTATIIGETQDKLLFYLPGDKKPSQVFWRLREGERPSEW